MGDLYQVNWTQLDTVSQAAQGHAKFTESQIDQLSQQANALAQQYTGNASIAYVSQRLAQMKKTAQGHSQAFLAHHQAHMEASQIASSTEAKNTSIVT